MCDSEDSKKLQIAGGVFLFASVLLCYFSVLGGGFIWDDDAHVVNDVNLESLNGLKRIWIDRTAEQQYYPLVHTSFWLEYRLWGLWPAGFHLSNILLHGINALLFWMILKKMSIPGAWLAAGVFALHPVHVESVAWISERKNVLSGAFYLSAMLAYLHFEPLTEKVRTRNWKMYIIALLLFCCALLSKSVTFSLPAALLLLVWWKRGSLTVRDLAPVLPMFLVGIAAGLNTYHLEKTSVGAIGADWDYSGLDRLLIAGRALWFYAEKLVWPNPLIFFYPRWTIDASVWWQYLFPVMAVALVWAFWRNRTKWGRGPLVALLFFGGTLLPALGFFNVYPMKYSFVADHFQYLASLGLITLIVSWAYQSAENVRLTKQQIRISGSFVLAVLGFLTWRQSADYQSAEILYRNTIDKNPDAWMAHVNLGILLANENRLDEATQHFQSAVKIKPDDVKAHLNLGLAYENLGRDEAAASSYQAAISQLSNDREENAEFLDGFLKLGISLNKIGRHSDAIPYLRRFLESKPLDAFANYQLGFALLLTDQLEEAVQHFDTASSSNPQIIESYMNCGIALARLKRFEAATLRFEKAAELNPKDLNVRYNLAKVLLDQGRFEQAVDHYQYVVQEAPDFGDAHHGLATVYLKLKLYEQSASEFKKVVSLFPQDPSSHLDLGDVLLKLGDREGARRSFHKALSLVNPNNPLADEIRDRLSSLENQTNESQ